MTPPRGLMQKNGSWSPRRMGFIRPRWDLTCRHGHRMRTHGIIREDYGLRCGWQAHAGAHECGLLIYVLVMPAMGSRRRFWAADVEQCELDLWEAQGYDVDQVLAFLGGTFPGPNGAA